MKDLLREGMAAGAAGLTTSTAPTHVDGEGRPVPSRGADRAEFLELARVLAEYSAGAIELATGTVAKTYDDAHREWVVQLSLQSGRPVLVPGADPRADDPDRHLRGARFHREAAARGARLIGQVRNHPEDRRFNFGPGPTLDTLPTAALDQLPTWQAVLNLPEPERLARLRDPETRARMRHEVDHPDRDPSRGRMLVPPRWATIAVARTLRPENARYEGRNLAAIAAEEGRHLADVMLDLAVAEDLATEFFYSGRGETEEEPLGELLRSPFTMVGTSDGGAHLERDDGADWSTYFLWRWVGHKGLMPLEEAIHRLTFFPASVMGLTDRGLLREGYAADLFLFDPQEIRPVAKQQRQDFPAGGTRYVTVPAGVHQVVVNGQRLVDEGQHTGAYPGRVLRTSR
jgi:N-acyl-D-aspartate/D-glutamate deacylase